MLISRYIVSLLSHCYFNEHSCMLVAKSILIPTLLTQKWNVACNSIVRYVFNLRRTDHSSHLVQNILDISLSQWIDLKTLIYFQKIVCTRDPSYMFRKFFQLNRKEHKTLLSSDIKPFARKGNSLLMLFAYGTIYLMLLKPSEARLSLSLKSKNLCLLQT